MKNKIVYKLSLFLGFVIIICSCAILSKNKKHIVKLKVKTTERIVMESNKYKIFLSVNQIEQSLEEMKEKGQEATKLFNFIRDYPQDTIKVEMAENNLLLKDDLQKTIFPIAFILLKEGQASIYNKENREFIESIEIIYIKGTYGGEQVYFKANGDILFMYLLSLGE